MLSPASGSVATAVATTVPLALFSSTPITGFAAGSTSSSVVGASLTGVTASASVADAVL